MTRNYCGLMQVNLEKTLYSRYKIQVGFVGWYYLILESCILNLVSFPHKKGCFVSEAAFSKYLVFFYWNLICPLISPPGYTVV